MPSSPKSRSFTPEEWKSALEEEAARFEKALRWLEKHMPPSFLEEVEPEKRMLIARNLLSFSLQNRFSQIHLEQMAIVLCLDGPDADVRILKSYSMRGIRYYRTFVSNEPPPGEKRTHLRIAILYFTEAAPNELDRIPASRKKELYETVKQRNPNVREADFDALMHWITPRFLLSMPQERLMIALDLYFRAKKHDPCQYEVKRNEDWKAKEAPSLQLVLAWRNVPKHNFLYRLAKLILRHGLRMRRVVAAYVDPYSPESVLILSLGLHGLKGKAAWEEADIDALLRELVLLKIFETDEAIDQTFVQTNLLTGHQAHLVSSMKSFIHQVLVYADPNLYSLDNVEEGLCRHPELTVQLCQAFEARLHPEKRSDTFQETRTKILQAVDNLDTGQAIHDLRRKNILRQALNFVDHTLKTNFYSANPSALSFRFDPQYLDHAPFERKEKFPELPYGIFFIRGMKFIGFNIRFKDLARGGVRTVMPEKFEQFVLERNSIFSEAYNLAYTQQKKNKDIPEGGAKTAILLEPFESWAKEEEIFRLEMETSGLDKGVIEEKIKIYRREHRLSFLYDSQRAFIESFMTLINCDEKGVLRAQDVVDLWKRPEYIYLGPDENMHNNMIEWIAAYAVQCDYRPGRSFMSSKPGAGINHKEYGVTSFGVNVYMHQTLLALGIDPKKDPFTVKISGGPDGDVAGNQILNLYKYYPKTARLLALVDVSGTIYDPQGLDLAEMAELFHKALPIRNYPPEKLSEGGFLLDLRKKREQTAYAQQTLCWRRVKGKLVEDWLSGNEMNHLFRNNVHQTKTDIFIPGGGRPRTLNDTNVETYLDEKGKPTSKAIVEGANLYLTPGARRFLEKLGVLIIKDSSCNKGGVICSSFEVLSSLCLSEEEFLKGKKEYVQEVLEIIGQASLHEAELLLKTHRETGAFLTEISDEISAKINLFKYQLLDHFETIELSADPHDFLIRCLIQYCPPLIRKKGTSRILAMPDIHKKAIIACAIAARLVYTRGLSWSPHIVDILPTLAEDPHLFP